MPQKTFTEHTNNFLSPPLRQQFDDAGRFHFATRFAEVPFAFEGPVQGSHNPVGEAVDVDGNVTVDLRPPRGQVRSFLVEAVDGLFAHIADKVHGALQI